MKTFPNFSKVSGSDHKLFCSDCNCTIDVKKGSVKQLEAHNGTAKLQKNVADRTNQTTLGDFMSGQNKVSRSELMYVYYLAKHNDAFLTADHFTHLCKSMFPDSQIAKNFKCSRTKATILATDVIAPDIQKHIVADVEKARYFSVLLDESTDRSTVKQLAVLVRYVSMHNNGGKWVIKTSLLDMIPCNKATGQNLFDCLMSSLAKYGLVPSNLVGMGSTLLLIWLARIIVATAG